MYIEFRCHFRRAYSVHVDGKLIGNIRRSGVGAAAVWSINIPGLNSAVAGLGPRSAELGRRLGEPSHVHFRYIKDARTAVTNHIKKSLDSQ